MASILDALTFPITLYDTVKKYYDAGKQLKEKYEVYKNAPEEVQKVQAFVQSMHDGRVKKALAVTERILGQDDIGEDDKNFVSGALKDLRDALKKADANVVKCFDEKNELKRKRYTLYGWKDHLEGNLKELNTWHGNFWKECDIIVTGKQFLGEPLLLQDGNFTAWKPMWGNAIEGSETVTTGKGELTEHQKVREVQVVIESFEELQEVLRVPSATEEDTAKKVKHITLEVANKLQDPDKGILPCLGYRIRPKELLFEYPSGFGEPRTVGSLLEPASIPGSTKCPLEYRFKLAAQLQDAIFSVVIKGYVHKNLRPDNLLVFSPKGSDASTSHTCGFQGLSRPFIVGWKEFRSQQEGTTMLAMTDWYKNFYRHPELQVETRAKKYNLLHDVYSLGVVLLEIGLWEPFVLDKTKLHAEDADVAGGAKIADDAKNVDTFEDDDDGEDDEAAGDGQEGMDDVDNAPSAATTVSPHRVLSENFKRLAEDTKLITREDLEDPRALSLALRKRKKSKQISLQKILISIAEKHLPQHMGTPFTKWVIRCLNAVEDRFDSPEEFNQMNKDTARKFKTLVLESYPRSIGF
ncbi:hypothetical protein LTR41_008386 [Exophiala xenobiotica]|nr:hypothetical protein LTR41_008386 [Exophiala xenobiotica]